MSEDLNEFERRHKLDRKRKLFAITIATKGQCILPLGTIEEVLRAVRGAGYLIIDKDRVVDLHTSHYISEIERDLAISPLLDHMRKAAAHQIARHMLDHGGIEFEKLNDGLELRSTAYVIWPKPHRELVRDEVPD